MKQFDKSAKAKLSGPLRKFSESGGDPQLMDQVRKSYSGLMERIARRSVGFQDWQEIVQSVFTEWLNNPPVFSSSNVSEEAFVVASVRASAKKFHRAKLKRTSSTTPLEIHLQRRNSAFSNLSKDQTPLAHLIHEETLAKLREAMGILTQEEIVLVRLHFNDKLGPAEISERLGLEPRFVNSKLNSAKKILGTELGTYLSEIA